MTPRAIAMPPMANASEMARVAMGKQLTPSMRKQVNLRRPTVDLKVQEAAPSKHTPSTTAPSEEPTAELPTTDPTDEV